MYTPYYDTFALADEQSLSVFDDESLELSDASSPQEPQFCVSHCSARGAQLMSELHQAVKSLRKAASLSSLIELSPDALSLLQATQTSAEDLCLKVAAEAESLSQSSPSSPIDDFLRELRPQTQITFPDYSTVLRPKTSAFPAAGKATAQNDAKNEVPLAPAPVVAISPKKAQESQGISFTTLTFGEDGSGIALAPRNNPMGPPKSRKGSKRMKAPYTEHLKAWRSEPYGPRQLSKAPNDLMMEFVLDPTTSAHQSHISTETAEFYITPPSAHQYNRQLN
jgi:hypothetical protein